MTAQSMVGVASDPVEVDAEHYKVEAESDRVRVLRITYAREVEDAWPPGISSCVPDGRPFAINVPRWKIRRDHRSRRSDPAA